LPVCRGGSRWGAALSGKAARSGFFRTRPCAFLHSGNCSRQPRTARLMSHVQVQASTAKHARVFSGLHQLTFLFADTRRGHGTAEGVSRVVEEGEPDPQVQSAQSLINRCIVFRARAACALNRITSSRHPHDGPPPYPPVAGPRRRRRPRRGATSTCLLPTCLQRPKEALHF